MNADTNTSFRQALPWVVFVSFLFLLNYSARCALSPLLVSLELDMQVGHAQATTLLLMQGVGLSISLGVGGFLLAYVRPAHMVVVSIAASGVIFLSMPLYTSFDQLRVAFLVFGLAAGLYFPAGMTTLGSLVSYKNWGKAVGIHELAPNISFIVFPLVAQGLLLFVTWRWVLVVWGAFMCVAAIWFARCGRGGQTYADAPSRSGSVRLLRHRSTWSMMYLLAIALVGEYAIFSVLQLYLVGDLQVPASEANYLMALSRGITPLMVILGGLAADRFPVRRFLCFTFTLHTGALLLMGMDNFYPAMTGMVIQAASIALTYPAVFKLLAECYPGGLQPLVLSLTMPAAGLIGTGVAPSLLGLAGETIGFGYGFMFLAGLSVLCVPIILSVRRYPVEGEQQKTASAS